MASVYYTSARSLCFDESSPTVILFVFPRREKSNASKNTVNGYLEEADGCNSFPDKSPYLDLIPRPNLLTGGQSALVASC